MDALLERYERQAVLLDEARDLGGGMAWDTFGDVLDHAGLPVRIKDNVRRSREARLAGVPQPRAGFGPFRQMVDGSVVPDANLAQITGTTEVGLYPAAQYTGFAANQLRAGQVWQLSCFGIGTTPGSSQGNITITPRFGTSTGGTSLGASAATALAASATNALWYLNMWFIVRAVGVAGANSHVIAGGQFNAQAALIAASTGQSVLFGSTAVVSVDLSVASGLFIGVTLGSASDTMTPLSHPILESLN